MGSGIWIARFGLYAVPATRGHISSSLGMVLSYYAPKAASKYWNESASFVHFAFQRGLGSRDTQNWFYQTGMVDWFVPCLSVDELTLSEARAIFGKERPESAPRRACLPTCHADGLDVVVLVRSEDSRKDREVHRLWTRAPSGRGVARP